MCFTNVLSFYLQSFFFDEKSSLFFALILYDVFIVTLVFTNVKNKILMKLFEQDSVD